MAQFRISDSTPGAATYLALALLLNVSAVAATPEPPYLYVSTENRTINLVWNAVPDAVGYQLYYAPYPDATPISNIDLGNSTIISEELSLGSAYYVALKSYNSDGSSDYSNVGQFIVADSAAEIPQIEYSLGAEMDPSASSEIRIAALRTEAFFASQSFPPIQPTATIHAYDDYQELLDAYIKMRALTGVVETSASADERWQDSQGGSFGNYVFINAANDYWRTSGTEAYKNKAVAGELFHQIQDQLVEGYFLADGSVAGVAIAGPRWLIEGSAELVSYVMIDWTGLSDFDSDLQSAIDVAGQVEYKLEELEDLRFYELGSRYSIGFTAAEFLSRDPSEYVSFYSMISDEVPWEEAFIQVFDRDINTFYAEFQVYKEELAARSKISFQYGSEVSAETAQSITVAATGTEEFFSSLGFPQFHIRRTLHVYANYDSLLEAYAPLNSVDVSTADLHWNSGNTVTMLGGNFVTFINLSSPGWAALDEVSQAQVVAQEMFSTLQFQLRNGPLYDDSDQVPSGGPVWLREGSKKLAGLKSTAWLGMLSFDSALESHTNFVKSISYNLAQMETQHGFNSLGGTQEDVGAVATNFLSADLLKFVEYYTALGDGLSWQDAFTQTFGKSVAAFYEEFAMYQSNGYQN